MNQEEGGDNFASRLAKLEDECQDMAIKITTAQQEFNDIQNRVESQDMAIQITNAQQEVHDIQNRVTRIENLLNLDMDSTSINIDHESSSHQGGIYERLLHRPAKRDQSQRLQRINTILTIANTMAIVIGVFKMDSKKDPWIPVAIYCALFFVVIAATQYFAVP